ncbi:MAG: DUF819 family protein [Ruminococcaceae bacterium]|nr:DUF819 family protein [Oscillospiraceae bacterium]
MINNGMILLILILAMIAFALWFSRTKVGKNFGPALTVIVIGIILHNVGLVPAEHEVFNYFLIYSIPIAISIMLLSVDLKEMRKLSTKPFIAMLSAVVSVCIMATIGGVIFGRHIDEGWKIAGMFVGTYTGGSNNLSAIAVALGASGTTMAVANTADYVIGMPFLVLLFASPAILGKWKWFHKVWPYHLTEEQRSASSSEEAGLLDAKTWSIGDIATLLALGFGINYFCEWAAFAIFPESFAGAGKMLMLTTLSLILAQIPLVKKLRGKMDLGMLISLTFLCIIGFMVDIGSFLGSAIQVTLFCFVVIVGSTILHLIFTRLLKLGYEYTILSCTAAIADGPSAGLVAGSANWKNLVTVSIICGTLGEVLGNYFGIGVAYLVHAIVGG